MILDRVAIANFAICLVALVGIGYEAFLIARRNRAIRAPGKDDFLAMMAVIGLVLLAFPFNQAASELESIRNILILIFIFATFAIRRGVHEKGIAKVFFIIPWRSIRQIHVDQHQLHQAKITFKTDRLSFGLIFPLYSLASTLDRIGAHGPEIMIATSVQEKLQSFPQK